MASCGPSRDRPGGVSQPIVEVGCSEPFGFELQRGAWKALWSEDLGEHRGPAWKDCGRGSCAIMVGVELAPRRRRYCCRSCSDSCFCC